ncbi:MAG: hypothetical protein ACRDBH_01090 [Bosea sp. (in: a-proteobacteria)]
MMQLSTLRCLEMICEYLKSNGESLTRQTILKNYPLNAYVFDEAIKFGIENGFIERSKSNWITLLKDFKINEEQYYPQIQNSVSDVWKSEKYDQNEFHIEITARRESKISGKWTRPDLTLVSYKKFHYTIGFNFDVVTFEVKRPDSCNVLAVFEALSHSSVATRAYVVFPMSEAEWLNQDIEQAKRVKEECSRHGVGLILIENIFEKPKAIHLIPAVKREIDHERCSSFLNAVLLTEGKETIAKWK